MDFAYKLIYNVIVLPAIRGGLFVLQFFLPKIRTGLEGRRGLIKRVTAYANQSHTGKLILFHCASAGELEALRPLASQLKSKSYRLALSYFSPSALESAARATEFEFSDYSPMDSSSEVNAYLDVLKPDLIAITKHDVWPNFVWGAAKKNIPILLINGNFHEGSLKTSFPLRGFHRSVYSRLSAIYTVSPEDSVRARLLSGDSTPVQSCGDSRFDRVIARRNSTHAIPEYVAEFCRGHFVIVAGSTHAADENVLFPAFKLCRESATNLRLIVVPHDVSDEARDRISSLALRSGLTLSENNHADILLINKSGILADLYAFGQVAYVGGGFGKGVHSVLEPMAAGCPVICGPNIEVSHEARSGAQLGIVNVIQMSDDLTKCIHSWSQDQQWLEELSSKVREFVESQSGATTRLAALIEKCLDHAARR